jgi:hypothetical protein
MPLYRECSIYCTNQFEIHHFPTSLHEELTYRNLCKLGKKYTKYIKIFNYACNWRAAFTVSVITKLTSSQQFCMEISYIEFYQNQAWNVQIQTIFLNLFLPLCANFNLTHIKVRSLFLWYWNWCALNDVNFSVSCPTSVTLKITEEVD